MLRGSHMNTEKCIPMYINYFLNLKMVLHSSALVKKLFNNSRKKPSLSFECVTMHLPTHLDNCGLRLVANARWLHATFYG